LTGRLAAPTLARASRTWPAASSGPPTGNGRRA
jgi:hypothetical protein